MTTKTAKREEREGLKYSLIDIQNLLAGAEEEIGKIGCTHQTNIARAKIEFNRLINEELARGRTGAVK